ncbi:MAG: sensor domain-containing diguanylate cyclase [Deltaproteobacteria bacterium]|nr:sensor domain-containing diguanylate cyclase [Deltaproteobacteria bacterium]
MSSPDLEKINQELEIRIKELALINEFSQLIVSTLELPKLYNILDHFLGEKLGFHEFALLLREGEEEVVVQVARGFADSSKVRGMSFKTGEGVTGLVFQSRQPYYIPDTRLEGRYLYYKGEKSEDGSFLSIPLLFKNEIVGILNFTRSGTGAFAAQEIQFLNTIAVQIAIALINAGLYSKTRELAVRDELTGLHNRRHFREILPLEIKRAERFGQSLSLLMIDIDHFKKYNDTFGHLEGDKRLREFSKLLLTSIRQVDYIARYGGEEFVVVLPNTKKEDAVVVAEKLRRKLASDPQQNLTVSMGIASYPVDATTLEAVLEAADKALYQAKWNGRDQVVVFNGVWTSPSADPANKVFSLRDYVRDKQGGTSA